MMAAFVHFDLAELFTLWKYLEYQQYSTNVRIFEQGSSADDYYVLWSGRVSARVRKETASTIRHANVARALALETEFVVNTMKAGETLGEAVVEPGGTRKAACVTEEPTELLVLRKKHFDLTFRLFLERAREEKIAFLSRLRCFRSLSAAGGGLSAMANFVREHKFRAGDVIVRQGSCADSMYFVKSGLVALIRTLNVRRAMNGAKDDDDNDSSTEDSVGKGVAQVCVTKLCTGDVFGEDSATDHGLDAVFRSSAVCETKVVCYRLDKNQMDQCGWDKNTRSLISIMAVKYPDDSVLLQALMEKRNDARVKKKMQKRLRTERKR